jgi:hypothetical protein
MSLQDKLSELLQELQDFKSPDFNPNPNVLNLISQITKFTDKPSAQVERLDEKATINNNNTSHSSKPSNPFHNIFDVEIIDENVKLIAELLYKFADYPSVEIEAKLGLLLLKSHSPPRRITIAGVSNLIVPVDSEEFSTIFLTEIDSKMFAHLNENLLKPRYELEAQSAQKTGKAPKISYKHPITTDKFYSIGGKQVRITLDNKKNNEIIASITKEKLKSLDFHNSTLQSLDFRVTAAIELPFDREKLPKNAIPDQIRRKDRLSYAFELWSIDITRVDTYLAAQIDKVSGKTTGNPKVSYEIEVELIDNEFVRNEAVKHRRGEGNQIIWIAQSLFDNLRTLSKFAFPNVQPPPSCRKLNADSNGNNAANSQSNSAGSGENQAKRVKLDPMLGGMTGFQM